MPDFYPVNTSVRACVRACDGCRHYPPFHWYYEDSMSAEQLVVNPAIVHAMRSKQAMGACSIES